MPTQVLKRSRERESKREREWERSAQTKSKPKMISILNYRAISVRWQLLLLLLLLPVVVRLLLVSALRPTGQAGSQPIIDQLQLDNWPPKLNGKQQQANSYLLAGTIAERTAWVPKDWGSIFSANTSGHCLCECASSPRRARCSCSQ